MHRLEARSLIATPCTGDLAFLREKIGGKMFFALVGPRHRNARKATRENTRGFSPAATIVIRPYPVRTLDTVVAECHRLRERLDIRYGVSLMCTAQSYVYA